VSAITQYDVVFIPRFFRQDCPFKGNIPEENPETNNNRVLRLKREQEQNLKQVGRQEKDLPKGGSQIS